MTPDERKRAAYEAPVRECRSFGDVMWKWLRRGVPREEAEMAKSVLRNWLVIYVEKYCDPVPDWKPQPDLLGMLYQADNASTVTGIWKARAEAAEKRESILRIALEGYAFEEDGKCTESGRPAREALDRTTEGLES